MLYPVEYSPKALPQNFVNMFHQVISPSTVLRNNAKQNLTLIIIT